MSHRFLSAVGALVVACLVFQTWNNTRFSGILTQIGSFISLILILQILVGASHQWFNFPIVVRIVHLSLATALWGGLVFLTTLLWINKPENNKISVAMYEQGV
jgi:heme A synthase